MGYPENSLGDEQESKPPAGLDLDEVRQSERQRRALIIDDDTDVVEMLKLILRSAGFNVAGAVEAVEAIKQVAETSPDVVLLDLHMPDMDGWEIMEQVHSISNAPILFISADAREEAAVRSLRGGADDYVRKPFTAKEIVARVHAALRRIEKTAVRDVRVFPEQGITIHLDTHLVEKKGQQVDLSPNEFAVLEVLSADAPQPVPYEAICEGVWGEEGQRVRRRLKWTIHLLRSKLEDDPSNPELIINKTKFGYQFRA